MGFLIRVSGANIGSYFGLVMVSALVTPLLTVIICEKCVGRAKRSVPTNFRRIPVVRDGGHGARAPSILRDPDLRHAFQKRLFRGLDRVGGSDMHPDAVEPQAEQALLLIGAIEHFGQRKLARGRIGK